MATKKKSKSVSKKKTAASKKSKSAPSKKKTSKKAAKKTGKKSSTSRKTASRGAAASFDASASDSHMDREFAAASSTSGTTYSTTPSYGAGEEEGKGSLMRLGALVVLAVVLIVLLYMQFTGNDTDEVASNNAGPAVEEPANPAGDSGTPASAEEDVAPAATENETPAPEPAPVASGDAKTYTVKAGDTLWGVAQSQMGNGNLWQKIYDTNKLTSRSLTAGQSLVIPAQ